MAGFAGIVCFGLSRGIVEHGAGLCGLPGSALTQFILHVYKELPWMWL
jgi:hypothetical protein